MHRKAILSAGCMAVATVSLGAAATAVLAQDQVVNGINVTRVEIPGDNGTEVFSKMPNGEWVQFGGRGEVRFHFDEIGRDATSVYLHDRARDFKIQLDVSDRTLSFRDANGKKAVFATMTSYTAVPVLPAVSVPRPTPTPTVHPPAGGNDGDDDFDPYKLPGGATSPAADNNFSPKSNADIIANAATRRPEFTRTGDVAASATAVTKGPLFDGPWVAEGVIAKENGDGIKSAVSWTLREALWITTGADDALTVHFDANPAGSVTLRKVGEKNEYAGSGYTASFAIIDKKNIRLNLIGGGTSREYNISTVPSGAKLSRSRIKPESDDEIDTFTAGNLVPRYTDMLLSYRSEKMDLFNAGRGAGPRIFKAPGTNDFSIESNLQSKTIPYGLRGQEVRRTEGNQLESVITNMASFEKSMSLNFGVSGSFRGASGGWEVSRQESKGAESTNGTTKAYGLARAEIYALFLDKPNMLLEPGFKYDILNIADGKFSPQQFITKYGTHYANAIHYGGIGKNQRSVTTQEYKKWATESTGYKQEGGFDAGPAGSIKAKGGLTMASGNTAGGTSMFSSESWSATGGTGSMSSNGWTVDERNSVPVRYDLRPLSELISPIFFGEEWSSPKRDALLNARKRLDDAITSFLQSQPKPDDRMFGPMVYKLTFHSIYCADNGDDGKGPAELYGNINAKVHGIDGDETLSLFTAGEDNPTSISCNGGQEHPINRSTFVASSRSGNDANKFASFVITTDKLYEYDPTAVDYDELVIPWPAASVVLKDWNAASPRTDIQGTRITNPPGLTYGPDLRIRVSFAPIQ